MAINNNDIRILLNTIVNKEREGFLQYDEFNNLLKATQRNYFDLHLRRYSHDWKSRMTLRPLQEEQYGLNESGSVAYGNLNDMARIIEARSDDDRFIEVLETTGDWYDRLQKQIKAPTKDYPICRLQSGSLEVKPATVTLKDIIYIRYPTEPYLDGYITISTQQFTYLEEGETVTLSSDEVALDGSTDTSYDSKTVEMEFNDEDKIEVAGQMLATLGITYSKQSLFEYMKLTNE
ncbi:hypothetical protein [Methanohalobium sp.]|uniref:hypothetical protein n=1 Tax=Methanohalobium sp. TaxID=2837493 RepID=UPI0025EB9FE5|nr:hypothetical protein [Methanohalobium sp.]